MKFWLLTLTQKPSIKSNHKLQKVADYKPVDQLKKGPQIFLFFNPLKGVKKVRLHTPTKKAQQCLC